MYSPNVTINIPNVGLIQNSVQEKREKPILDRNLFVYNYVHNYIELITKKNPVRYTIGRPLFWAVHWIDQYTKLISDDKSSHFKNGFEGNLKKLLAI